MDFDFIVASLEKSVHREHAFFSNYYKYQSWHDDRKNFNLNEVSDLNL